MPLKQQPRGRRLGARPALYALALAAGLAASVPAIAGEYRARDVGGWIVAPSSDGKGCFLTRQYAGVGDTTLLFGVDADGSNHLSILNDNWSIKPRERLKLNFGLSSGSYGKHEVIGMASDGKRGFVTSFEAKFPAYFASSLALDISRGDVPVEHLSLTGSGAAVAELRRCVDAYRAKPGTDTKKKGKRSGLIPKDPFAPGVSRRPKR